jgi:hypothetical protein
VNHSENTRTYKETNVHKNRLRSAMTRSNSKSWVTRQYFTEWFDELFAPIVKKYLEEKNVCLKAL